MRERLRPRDRDFLSVETPTAPRHNATLEIFDPADSDFSYGAFRDLISDRISFVPRYRQRVLAVPGHLASPVWVDDPNFDLGYHVRRSALPRPGTEQQLTELVARIVSRPLDRNRPLWEVYVVEGLTGDRVAVLYKAHQALVDGVHTVDLGQLLLDVSPEPKEMEPDDWAPRPKPSPITLVAGAVTDSLTQPETLLTSLRVAGSTARRQAEGAATRGRQVASALTGRRPASGGVGGPLSQHRRIVTLQTDLADYRTVRDAHGGTVNDVILATLTGALRSWLMTRSESMGGLKSLKAVVPVSVIDEELEATSLGSQIAAHYVRLPIGEASPVVRLHQVSYSFQAHKETGRSVAANRLAGVAGFAPTTFHAIGSRVASDELRRGYHLSVTNVPGPQSPLYAAGAKMVATYPVPPLMEDHPLSIGVTSYNGHVFYGLTADHDQLPDADVLASCIREALDELLDASSTARPRASRGSRRAGRATKKAAKGSQR